MSPRQREIWGLLAEGLSDKAIADRLHMSERTVSNALTVVYNEVCGPTTPGVNRRVKAAVLHHRARAERASGARVGK